MTTTHTVLGAGGVVGRETVDALLRDGRTVSAVARSAPPQSDATPVVADLLDAASATAALRGTDVAYLTVGLPYSTKVWLRDWPTVMRNTIGACLANGSRLVYFDNVYVYGKTDAPMTESTPIAPVGKKGAVRAALVRMLETAAAERGLEYLIARSADFYGPAASTSVFNTFAIDKMAKGQPPTWLYDAQQPHSMTYTPDIGRALALLGTDAVEWNRTWHLPTAPALTGDEYLELVTGGSLPHRTMSLTTMRFGALFVAAARESLPMAYQNTAPYLFDSTAFEAEFELTPTPYRDGIAASLAATRPSRPSKASAQTAG